MGPKGPWTLANWANAYGPVFKIQFMASFAVVLTDHDGIMRVTRKTSEPHNGHHYDRVDSVAGVTLQPGPITGLGWGEKTPCQCLLGKYTSMAAAYGRPRGACVLTA